jgi:hypothetical protein
MRRTFFTLIIFISVFKVNAQSVPVGVPALDDYYRREQLLGKVDSNFSFTIRPIFTTLKDVYDPDSTLKKDHWMQTRSLSFAKGLGQFQILPLTWQQQFNSNHPYGWNDGAMIPAKGYQTMISGGFYLKLGPLSIQLKPEFVSASNPNYYSREVDIINSGALNKVFWGQSSIRLTFGPISAGLSNENLWWGPGIRNSLILSNNAPGFNLITLNTVRPIKTYIGYFEGQIIGGHLKSLRDPLPLTSANTAALKDNTRYFTGFNINYHPKWINGLIFGLTRTFSAYARDISGFSGYIPFFTPYSKQATQGGIDDGIGDPYPRDQYTSFYARWLFTKANAEVYFEYGINDNSYNINDFIGSPDHSRAYLFGLRKMIPLNDKNAHILLGGEITQLSQSPDRLVRPAGTWYSHYQIIEGHTNLEQYLGAGIGPGGNLQSIDISWVSGLKRLGVSFDRYEHEVDYSDENFPDINGNSRKWVDFAFGLQGEWNYKNLLFNAKIQHIKSLNYQWILKDYVPGQYYIPHNDVYNFHGQLGLTYRF